MSSALSIKDDIDPGVLAEVARVVQELLRMQELEQQLMFDDERTSEHINSLKDVPLLQEGKMPQQGGNARAEGFTGCAIKDPKSQLPFSSRPWAIGAPATTGTSPTSLPVPTDVDVISLPPGSPSSQDDLKDLKPLSEITSPSTAVISTENQGSGSDTAAQINLQSEQKAPATGTRLSTKKPFKSDLNGSKHDPVDIHLLKTSPGVKDGAKDTASIELPMSNAIVPRPLAPPRPARQPRKKALLIGINYFGDPNQLLGCINDTRDVFGFLSGHFSFRYQDTVMLTDDQIYEDKRPTGANIRYWMKWLVKDAEPQDSLFFHYAGQFCF